MRSSVRPRLRQSTNPQTVCLVCRIQASPPETPAVFSIQLVLADAELLTGIGFSLRLSSHYNAGLRYPSPVYLSDSNWLASSASLVFGYFSTNSRRRS